MMMAWKTAAALAAGCTIVVKPSELTPLTALAICELGKEAGLPNGVLNTVPGLGSTTGSDIAHHMGIDKVSYLMIPLELISGGLHGVRRDRPQDIDRRCVIKPEESDSGARRQVTTAGLPLRGYQAGGRLDGTGRVLQYGTGLHCLKPREYFMLSNSRFDWRSS